MGAPWCRWLAGAAAVLALLAAAPRLATASGPVPVPSGGGSDGWSLSRGRRVDRDAGVSALHEATSRRIQADDVAGTYSLFGYQESEANGCPATLKLDSPVQVPRASTVELLRFPGESIIRDGTRCAGGSLLVIRTLGLFNPAFMAKFQLDDAILRVNRTALMRNWLEWSDSVGLITDSWACGSVPRWNSSTTYMLFGDDGWALRNNVRRTTLVLEDGRPHVMIVNNRAIVCILRAPTPSTATPEPIEDAPSPGAAVQVSGGSDGLQAGPVVGIALGSAVAAVATAGIAAFGYWRWATARGSGGGSGSSGRGGGSGGGDGGGGAPAVGGSAGAPVEAPGIRLPGVPLAHKPAAAAPFRGAVASPSSAPPLPAGLMYSWETVTPGASAAPLGGS